jgi:hypothetical protein
MKLPVYYQNKIRKFAKQTWAGPGKFGVFILLCIMTIATCENLGLANKELNLEKRTIPLNVIHERKFDENFLFDERILITYIDKEKLIQERENILLSGAMNQFNYERGKVFENEKIFFDI